MTSLPPRPAADLDRLRSVELQVAGRFGDASNATLLVHLGAGPVPPVGDLRELEADRWGVYKPRAGEAPLWDFPSGTLCQREVAAFEVDRALGWSMVPPTVLREDGPMGVGSLQLFVPHDPERHLFALVEDEEPADATLRQVERMVAFDTIVENADRKAGHVLAQSDGSGADLLWLVDHGVCFHAEPHLRTVAWHLAGTDVDPDDRDDAARLVEELAPGAALEQVLATLLGADEMAALRSRAGSVAAPGSTHPHPTVAHPMPWPPI